jgi:hypothetical protein
MANSFSADVNKWIRASQGRFEAVLKQSAQDVINIAQTPRAKGGRMRVDTGFMINSGRASIGVMPVGESRKPSGYDKKEFDDGQVILTLARLRPGQVLYFGWTANYALIRENKDGFLRMAVQQWQQIVNKNAAELRRRIN